MSELPDNMQLWAVIDSQSGPISSASFPLQLSDPTKLIKGAERSTSPFKEANLARSIIEQQYSNPYPTAPVVGSHKIFSSEKPKSFKI